MKPNMHLIHSLTPRIKRRKKTLPVPEFKVTQCSSMRSAVKGLTVIVAAYSIGTPFSILCQTFSSFTI